MTIVATLGEWLRRVGAPWYVYGGQAALIHGSSRLTDDYDATVIGGPELLDRLLEKLPEGFERRADRAFTERTRVLPLTHTPTAVSVDVTLGSTRFEADIASRAEWVVLDRARVRVVSAEDLIVLKILAGRPSDLLDVAAVLVAQPALDLGRVRLGLATLEKVVEGRSLSTQLDQLLVAHVTGAPETPIVRRVLTPAVPTTKRRPAPIRSDGTRASRSRGSVPPPNALNLIPEDSEVRVLVLEVALTGAEPRVWRRLVVRADCTFWALHMAIQDAMGWSNAHLHEFRAPRTLRKRSRPHTYGSPREVPLPGESGPLAGWEHTIAPLLAARGDCCEYLYDYGDHWLHDVRVEEAVTMEADARLPQCPDGARACPPESCGGLGAFEQILAGELDGPLRDAHGDYDPAAFDPRRVVFQDPARALRAMLRTR